MRLRRSKRSLVDRLRPYVDTGPSPAPMVSADPIRMFLYRWMIETGDPVEVVAKGFALGRDQVVDLLSGELRYLTYSEAARLCGRLQLEPGEVWPPKSGESY